MTASIDRRRLIQAGAVLGVGAGLPLAGCGGSGGAQISAEAVGEGAAVFRGAGGAVVAVQAGDGVLLVDTGAAESADALMRAVRSRFGGRKPIAAFNTHWHYDHTGGDAAAKALGAKVWAHENTRLWLQGDFYSPWEDRHYTPRPEEFWPTDTFYGSGSTVVGGLDVDYIHMKRAHTDGDVVVHIKDADLIVAGGIVSVGVYPTIDWYTGGWIGALVKANEALLALAGPDTRIEPAEGPVVGREHLEKQHDMLATARDRIFAQVRLGKSAEEMLEARVTEGYDAEWGDPAPFVKNVYPGLWAHSNELGQVV
jgi:glyoxylase-like metal-dependent hydrolase (beta-lactamase superfamily II)